MKVIQDMQATQTVNQVRKTSEGKQTFEAMVQSQTHKLRQQELKHLMTEITKQGDKLAHYRTFKELAKFKHLVKGFLEETVYNGLDLNKSHHFRFNGESQELALVKEIDEKIIELTEDVMNQEKKSVDLMGMIGEIKGLLINLYM